LDLLDLGSSLADTVMSASGPRIEAVSILTHTLPMREFGMMNLIVTALDPGTDATSNGSSLILRTMRPKHCESARVELSNSYLQSYLGNGIQCTRDIEDPFWVSYNRFRHGDSCI
jgi:hypothetical protein